MGDIDVAGLYQKIGALTEASQERKTQNSEIFRVLRHISETMATKDDLAVITKRISGGEDGLTDLQGRVSDLESDRKVMRAAHAVAWNWPPVLAALIEIGRWFLGKHT
jgi:hypothetical protein